MMNINKSKMAWKIFLSPKSEKILPSNPSTFPRLRRLQMAFRLCGVILAGRFEWIHSAAELRDYRINVCVAHSLEALRAEADVSSSVPSDRSNPKHEYFSAAVQFAQTHRSLPRACSEQGNDKSNLKNA